MSPATATTISSTAPNWSRSAKKPHAMHCPKFGSGCRHLKVCKALWLLACPIPFSIQLSRNRFLSRLSWLVCAQELLYPLHQAPDPISGGCCDIAFVVPGVRTDSSSFPVCPRATPRLRLICGYRPVEMLSDPHSVDRPLLRFCDWQSKRS